jgi:hypothetical protein
MSIPTYVASKVVEQSEAEFPTVTICPMEQPLNGTDIQGIWDLMEKFEMRLFRNSEAGFYRYSFREARPHYAGVTEYQHSKLGTCYGILPNRTFLDIGIYYIRIY